MTPYEQKKLDLELKAFISRHLIKPSHCKNLGQLQFYIRELSDKIRQYQEEFDYVPATAYSLLAQYNSMQNQIVGSQFFTENS